MTGVLSRVGALPRDGVPEARTVATRLRSAALSAREGLTRLDAAAPPSWAGPSSEGYYAQRAGLSQRLVDLDEVCTEVAAAVDEYADRVDACASGLRRAADDLETAQARVRAEALTGDPLALQAEVRRAQNAYDTQVSEYEDAVRALTRRARDCWERLRPEPVTIGEHAVVAGETVWRLGVVETTTMAWQLTGGLFQDPQRWWATVRGIPAAQREAITHPVNTASETVGWEHYAEGRWGQGVGTTMAALGAKGLGKTNRALSDAEKERFARNMADPTRPRPRPQTVDELLNHVHLRASEHHQLGHTIRRHVDVDDDYLNDRLDNGTIYDDATRAKAPKPGRGKASAWDDLESAERIITMAVRRHEDEIRQWLAGDDPKDFPLKDHFPGLDTGRVIVDGPNGRETVRVSHTVVVLARDGDGFFIKTAYPNKPTEN